MTSLAAFLLARIDELEELASERDTVYERKAFPFYEWITSGQRHDQLYGRTQQHRFEPHEEQLIRQFNPAAVREECARRRRIVHDCEAALTFGTAPGMEGARVLAQRVLEQLALAYADHADMPGTGDATRP
ncbi:DUF6221 family protein [Geodermatophilus sp. SYSU D00700]